MPPPYGGGGITTQIRISIMTALTWQTKNHKNNAIYMVSHVQNSIRFGHTHGWPKPKPKPSLCTCTLNLPTVCLITHLHTVRHYYSRVVSISCAYSQLGYLSYTRPAVCIDTSKSKWSSSHPVIYLRDPVSQLRHLTETVPMLQKKAGVGVHGFQAHKY